MKKLACLLLALLMVLGLAACQPAETTTENPQPSAEATQDAGGETAPTDDESQGAPAVESSYDTHLTISMNVLDAEKTNTTRRDEWFREKFNIDWDLIPVTWGDWTEKVRA